MKYFLMHKNLRVALFTVDRNNVSLVKINEAARIYLPIGVSTEPGLRKWIEDRGVPVTRQRLSIELKALGVSSPFELMIKNYGVSLTDHYWICDEHSTYTWESINLYQNNFQSTFSLDLRDDAGIATIVNKTNFVPSTSLKGDLKKKWIVDRQSGRRVLVKGTANNTCRQSLSEVFATLIHQMQARFPYTPYSLIKISSDNQPIIGCECPNFTDLTNEFVSAYDISNAYITPNDMSEYEAFIRFCYSLGVDIRNFIEYQIMTDFIISNTDRHFNNFGMLRNSETLSFVGPAPIFDSGNSLFYDSSYIPLGKELLKLKVNSFRKKEVDLLSYVNNRGLVNLNLLPNEDTLYNLLKLDINTRDEVNEKIVMAYRQKIKYLSDFQNGCNIWDYTYKG